MLHFMIGTKPKFLVYDCINAVNTFFTHKTCLIKAKRGCVNIPGLLYSVPLVTVRRMQLIRPAYF